MRRFACTLIALLVFGPALVTVMPTAASAEDVYTGPTAWAEMVREYLRTGELPEPASSNGAAAGIGSNFPGVDPQPNLNLTTLTPDGGETETSVAVGLGANDANIIVGYNDLAARNGGLSGYAFSTDRGETFTQSTAMPQPVGGNLLGDPVLDVTRLRNNRVYYASLCSGGPNPAGALGICISISNNGGQTFGAPIHVANATGTDSFDKEWLAVDDFDGDIYIPYTNFLGGGGSQIELVICNADVTACSPPTEVFAGDGDARQGVAVSFGHFTNAEIPMVVRNRTDNTLEFQICDKTAAPPAPVGACQAIVNLGSSGAFQDPGPSAACGRPALTGGFRYEPFPQIASDHIQIPSGNGQLHIVDARDTGGGSGNDIVYFRAADGAGAPAFNILGTRVNDDAPGIDVDQFWPHVTQTQGDPTGRINLTWYDRRNDALNNRLIDVFHTESVDRGITMNTNGKVTDVSFPALPRPSNCYWGDYIGHDASPRGDRIFAAWGDDRRGQVDTFFAALHNSQDVRVQSPLDFGLVAVNPVGGEPGSKDLTFSVFNVGDQVLNVNSVVCSAGNCTDFTVLNAAATPLQIAPNDHFDFIVRFDPTAAGNRTATFDVATDDPDTPIIQVVANGVGAVPDLNTTFPGSVVQFGDSCVSGPVGTMFRDQAIQFVNQGNSNLAITAAFISAGGADFSVIAPGSNFNSPLILQPGETMDFVIRFDPSSIGAKVGTLTINSNDPAEPTRDVSLAGNAPAGEISVSPSTLSFGNVPTNPVGGEIGFKDLPVQVHNTGLCNLGIQSISAIAGNTADFSLIVPNPAPPVTLSPDANYNFSIRFNPSAAGARSATIRVVSDSGQNPGTFTTNTDILANGVGTVPDINVSGSLNFGRVRKGFKDLRVEILNQGNSNLQITNIFLTGNPSFSLPGPHQLPLILSPDAHTFVVVRCQPTKGSPKIKTATLHIQSNDPDEPTITINATCRR